MHDHRFAMNLSQRLVGQPGRVQSGRDYDQRIKRTRGDQHALQPAKPALSAVANRRVFGHYKAVQQPRWRRQTPTPDGYIGIAFIVTISLTHAPPRLWNNQGLAVLLIARLVAPILASAQRRD
jgi:hypothetical protein